MTYPCILLSNFCMNTAMERIARPTIEGSAELSAHKIKLWRDLDFSLTAVSDGQGPNGFLSHVSQSSDVVLLIEDKW
jgi:hypothetical protein